MAAGYLRWYGYAFATTFLRSPPSTVPMKAPAQLGSDQPRRVEWAGNQPAAPAVSSLGLVIHTASSQDTHRNRK